MSDNLKITIVVPVPDDLLAQHKTLAPILAALDEFKGVLPKEARMEHSIITYRGPRKVKTPETPSA